MNDHEQAYELLKKLRRHVDEYGSIEAGEELTLLSNLADRTQRLEVNQSQVDYTAQARAQREEAEAKRDLALLLLSVARSVTSWFRPTVVSP